MSVNVHACGVHISLSSVQMYAHHVFVEVSGQFSELLLILHRVEVVSLAASAVIQTTGSLASHKLAGFSPPATSLLEHWDLTHSLQACVAELSHWPKP